MNEGRNVDPDDGRITRKNRKRTRVKGEILDAARAVLREVGPGAFTVEAVASALGLTKAALYYYFKGRDALLFAVGLRVMLGEGQAVQAAVEAAETGPDAIEAQMRAVFDYYAGRLEDYRLVYQVPVDGNDRRSISPEMLEQVRPLNAMNYGTLERKLRAGGTLPGGTDPRRLAFLSHAAVLGLLAMKSMVESADDPLIHTDADLMDDLVRVYRAAAGG